MLPHSSKNADVIFCIDGTGSMLRFIEKIMPDIKSLCQQMVEGLTRFNKDTKVNLKVITFRDYQFDSNAMVQSQWFDLTAGQDDDLLNYIGSIDPYGGGDEPENGLEALFYAMTSKWNAVGNSGKQIIVLLTDAHAKPLGEGKDEPDYPKYMVDYDGLLDTWRGICPSFISQADFNLSKRNKRLIMFAPEGTLYEKLYSDLDGDHCVFYRVRQDDGLYEIEVDDIVRMMFCDI